jgi:hypothetical protein
VRYVILVSLTGPVANKVKQMTARIVRGRRDYYTVLERA